MNKTPLIQGNGFLASPNMIDFATRMVRQEMEQEAIRQEIRKGLRPAPSDSWGIWNISDRHWSLFCYHENRTFTRGLIRGGLYRHPSYRAGYWDDQLTWPSNLFNRSITMHTMNFKDKRWGAYKKWEDHAYVYFDRIVKCMSPMIIRPSSPIISICKNWTHMHMICYVTHHPL